MSIQQSYLSPINPPRPQPWQEKQLSSGTKMLVVTGMMLLAIVFIVSTIIFLAVVIPSFFNPLKPGDTMQSLITQMLIAVTSMALSLLGLIVIFPYATASNRIKLSYAPVPASARSYPFKVQYQRTLWGRSMSREGCVRFDSDALLIDGYLTAQPIVNVLVLVIVTLLPLIVFGIGLGFIPAMLLAYHIGRKKISQPIPYANLRDLRVKGCKLTCTMPGAVPSKLSFYVDLSDGERLYSELQEHFPALMINMR